MKVTRRNIVQMAATVVVTGTAPTQSAIAQTTATSKDDDLKNAREQMGKNFAQITKVKLPMATEPAFRFKA